MGKYEGSTALGQGTFWADVTLGSGRQCLVRLAFSGEGAYTFASSRCSYMVDDQFVVILADDEVAQLRWWRVFYEVGDWDGLYLDADDGSLLLQRKS
jgi:hypothetical protein